MILTTPPAAPRPSAAREQAAIRALRASHNEALAALDADAVVALCTEACIVIIGGSGQLIQGKAAYRDFVRAAFADRRAMRFVRTAGRIDIGAPEGFAVAAETGRWVGTATDGSGARIGGCYLVHWTKKSGEWRIASETYVTVA